jgi:hypothetical protein
MVLSTDLRKEVDGFLSNGNQIRFKYFTTFYEEDDYDNPNTIQSGTDLWCSGLIFPINLNKGSSDAVFLQQGLILPGDRRIYVNGSVNTSGIFRIGVGSPIINEYVLTSAGAVGEEVDGTFVYKCLYVRCLNAGSLTNE